MSWHILDAINKGKSAIHSWSLSIPDGRKIHLLGLCDTSLRCHFSYLNIIIMSNASRPQIARPPVSPLHASPNITQGGPYSRRPSTALGGNSPSAYDSAHRLPSHGLRHPSVGVTGTLSGSGSGSSAPNLTTPSTLPAGVANPNQQQKARAKDLLRKHYGLGVGPPPPRPVGSNSQDPMDMSE